MDSVQPTFSAELDQLNNLQATVVQRVANHPSPAVRQEARLFFDYLRLSYLLLGAVAYALDSADAMVAAKSQVAAQQLELNPKGA